MAAPATAVLPAGYAPLFPGHLFSGDAQKIVPFLDDLTTLITARVSRAWNQNAQLKLARTNAREDAACLQEGFDERIIRAFRSRQISLWRLPVCDLGDRNSDKYIYVKSSDLSTPLMRFKAAGRVGLAFDLQGYAEGSVEKLDVIMGRLGKVMTPIRELRGGIAVFQTLNDPKLWTEHGELEQEITDAYEMQHKPHHTGHELRECLTCPRFKKASTRGCLDFVTRIVTDNDPAFRLTGPITVVDNPLPLPTLLPKPRPAVAEPKPEQSCTLWSCLSATASCLLQMISALFEAALSCVRALLNQVGL